MTDSERLDEISALHAQAPGWLLDKSRVPENAFLLVYARSLRNALKALMLRGHVPPELHDMVMKRLENSRGI